ncbi:hypothetical protein [Pararhizobium sp. O133]|uniref:hypothetical protein n=1 Tax=Pararhizobium sp. O133 TaxID=3449278 RepID=UPI003F685E54
MTKLGTLHEVDTGMPATSYTDYLRGLRTLLDRVRDKPFEYRNALIEMAIYRNGYGYRSRELLSGGRLVSEYHAGPLNAQNWLPDNKRIGRTEIEGFFNLPEIYAYSDNALAVQQSPLSTAHWNATVGLFDVLICERNSTPRRQRMLFAGFADKIHAEFFLATDHDLIVHDHSTGAQLFEWRTDEPNQMLPQDAWGEPGTDDRHSPRLLITTDFRAAKLATKAISSETNV